MAGGATRLTVPPEDVLALSMNIERGLLAFSQLATPTSRPSLKGVTLATHLHLHAVHNLFVVAAVWKGPISCSVMLDDETQLRILYTTIAREELRSASFHVVMNEKCYKGVGYPIGHLMNIAIAATQTRFVNVLDAGAVPRRSAFFDLSVQVRSVLSAVPASQDSSCHSDCAIPFNFTKHLLQSAR
eukprot:559195-Rhodomonas_salina.1